MRHLLPALILVALAANVSVAALVLGERHLVTASGYHPRWSPDATQIAFVDGEWPEIDIYVAPAAGGERALVPMTMGGDLSLSWRPNGQEITFDAYSPDTERLDIYSVTLATGAITRLTYTFGFGPAWNRDGTRVAFGRNNEIYSMAADGTDVRRHTGTRELEYYPCWSPDGTRLAYAAERGGNTDVYIVEIATALETRFTTDPALDARVVWSPDGQWLAWDSFRDGAHHVYARPVTGGGDVCLTCDHADGGMADWAPDGSGICYVAEGGIWVLELDGIVANRPASLGSLKAMYRD